MSATPPTQKRRLPSSPSLSPRFFHPMPQMQSRSSPRANAATPRAQSPQDSFFTAPPFGFPSPKPMSPTSPVSHPLSYSPHLRHLSPAPSSGVSSVRSMSEAESSDEEIFSPTTQNPIIHLPDPDSDSETEETTKSKEMEVIDIDLMDPTFVPLDMRSDTTSLFAERIFSPASTSTRGSSLTIEELPALPVSPALSRTHSTGSSISGASAAPASHVSWQDSGIEIIQGEYSSCASSSDLEDTTDDPQTEDDDDFEWNVDVCSSSYPTDDFLLGGLLGLSTGGHSSAMHMGLGLGLPKAMDPSFGSNVSARPATPFNPRRNRGPYSTISTPTAFTQTTERSPVDNSANNTLKRRSLNTPNTKKRRRIISLFDDKDGEGDDESDDAENCGSPAKRVKGRMTIDSVLNSGKFRIQQEQNARRGSLSQMFGVVLGDDMDVDL